MRACAKTALDQASEMLKTALGAVAGFSIAINLLVLALPLYSMQVFDRVLTSHSLETLVALTILTLGLLALQAALDHVRATVLRRAAIRLDAGLTGPALAASLDESLRGNPYAAAGLRDLREIRTLLASPNIVALFDLPLTPFFILVIILIHPGLGLFVLAAIALLAVLAGVHALAARRPQDETTISVMRAGESVQDYIRHAEVVHALGMRRDVLERWRGQNNGLLALDALLGDRVGTVLACTKFVRMGIQVGITGIGAALALDGTISPGAMIASSLLMSRALAPIEQAVGAWRTWSSALVAARRLRTALAREVLAPPVVKLPTPQGRLTVTNLIHRQAGCELPVLRGLSLTLEAGQALAVVGASGSGKSTLMRLLAGVLRPTSGEVRLDGADLGQWDSCDLGRHVGYLPQNVQLLNGTVAENISRFTAEPSSERIIEASRMAGVHDLILRLPEGYSTVIGEGGHQLSGGQQQRIGLARALYGEPRLILLDEPNSNLDPEGEAALVEALHACRKIGRTVVLVSHRAALLRFVDWIVVLREGRIERAGARGELMRTFATQTSEVDHAPVPQSPPHMARASQ